MVRFRAASIFIRPQFAMCWELTVQIFAMSRVAGWIAHIQE